MRTASSVELGIVERLALDLLAALGLQHRPRDRPQGPPVEVAEAVDRELRAVERLLVHRFERRVALEERELVRVRGPVDVARGEPQSRLEEHRIWQVRTVDLPGQPRRAATGGPRPGA